jgi:hypothetical protein
MVCPIDVSDILCEFMRLTRNYGTYMEIMGVLLRVVNINAEAG